MEQLFVFAEKKYHNRLKYVLDFLTDDATAVEWMIGDSDEFFFRSMLIYSEKETHQKCLQLSPSRFLEKGFIGNDLHSGFSEPGLTVWEKNGDSFRADFDVFGHIFFFLSRMEEYERDAVVGLNNRFSARESVLFKAGLINYPIVDFWRNDFLEVLKKMIPGLKVNHRKFQWELSCDVDVLYAFKGKGVLKNMAGLTRDLLCYNSSSFRLRWDWLFLKKKDPFDQLDQLIGLVDENRGLLKTFVLCPSSMEYAEDLSGFLFLKYNREFFRKYGDRIELGLHPSIGSSFDIERLIYEKNELEELSGIQIKHSRQHYLLLDIPLSYHNLIAAGICDDYSMAFHDHIGFRAGTTLNFFWYNIQEEKPSTLKIHPFCLMDVHLKKYMKLNPGDAGGVVKKMMDNIKSVNGNFLYLWHNSSLSSLDGWAGWENFPTYLTELANTYKS